MKSLVKKSMLLGIGITALTKNKIESVVKDLKKSGDLNVKEGKELVSFMVKESEKKHKELSKIIEKHVDSALKKAKIATKSEIVALEKKIKTKAITVKKATPKKVKKVIKKAKNKIKKKVVKKKVAKKPIKKTKKKRKK